MSVIVIPTVEHTGSRLLANHILHHLSCVNLHSTHDDDCKFYEHVSSKNIDIFIDISKLYATIIPLRHPMRCAWSWEQRQKPLKRYFEQWDLIIKNAEELNASYLRVDLKERNEDLDKINKRFNLELETIWPYVGEAAWPWVSENTPGIIPLEECKLRNESAVLKYIQSNKDFFGVHYGG